MTKQKKPAIAKRIVLFAGVSLLLVSISHLAEFACPGGQTAEWTSQTAIWYKDSNNPTGIPDFSQYDRPICGAAAVANCLWYWDHHGFPNLVNHWNPNDHSENWVGDAWALVTRLEHLIYNIGLIFKGYGMEKGTNEYLKERGKIWKFCEQKGLKAKEYFGCAANYTLYKNELERCQDVIPYFKAHRTGGGPTDWVKIRGKEWYHAMTAAGLDQASPPTRLPVSNPWGNHDSQPNPVDQSYYDELHLLDPATTGDKIRVNGGIAGIPPSGSDYVEMTGMLTICPYEAHEQAKHVRGESAPGAPGFIRYHYTVYNFPEIADVSPVALFALEIQTPFDTTSVTAPDGWQWRMWDPNTTPTLCTELPITDSNYVRPWEPPFTGILWYTYANPIYPGDSLTCFSFQAPDVYPPTPWASYRGLSSSEAPDYAVSDFGYTLGPSVRAIPTLTEWGLIIFGVVLLGFITWVFLKRRKVVGVRA